MSSLNPTQYIDSVENFLQHFNIAEVGARSTILIDVPGFIVLDRVHFSYHGPVTLYVPTTYDGPTDTPIGKLLALFNVGVEGVGRVTELNIRLNDQEYRLKAQTAGMDSVNMSSGKFQHYRVPTLDQVVIYLLNEIVADPRHALFCTPNWYLTKYRESLKVSGKNKGNTTKVNGIVNELLQVMRDQVTSGSLITDIDITAI